ncbi:hypothetical protein [Novacetimonas hansenii]|uniref:hypothetical protein n=1 Tax=Novacetimonas hansenii TaxID=436 RepID=UPI00094F7237|nr:hypothetical protein [Novacetimonas hansenii]
MKHIALALSLLVPISAQARSPVPPSQWTQNYIPSLADWKSALLYNGLPLGQALENEILRASDGEALKLNRNDDTSINQILTTPTIHGGAAMGQSLTTPTINGGIATGQVLSRPTITNGTAVGMNIGASTSTPLNAPDARLVSDKFGEALSVLDFGAKCDGTTDDTVAFNAATAAVADTKTGSGGSVLHHVLIPGKACVITGTVNLPRGVWLSGTGMSGSELIFGDNSQILFTGNNVTNSWVGSRLSDLYINVSGVTSAQKYPIDAATNAPVSSQIDHLQIEGGTYYGIDMSGNNVTVDTVFIQGVKAVGIRVGHGSTGGNNTDPRIINTTVSGDYFAGATNASSAILTEILDAGGLTLQNNDMVGGKIGTLINPQTKQTVFHMFASNTVLSDSAQQYGMEIDTGAATSTASDMKFDGSWTANAQSMDVAINNNGGGNVNGYMFVGHRFYLANGDAFHAGTGVQNVTITGSQFCGNSSSGTGVFISKGDSGFIITNNRMPSSCGGEGTGNSAIGVSAAGANDHTVIVGNDMNGIAYPINFTVSDANVVAAEIAHNIGPDRTMSIIAASTTSTLPANIADYAEFNTSDGATVETLVGGWFGRHVFLHNQTSGSITFGTNANICNRYILAKYAYVEAIYTPRSCWYLH